MERHHNNDQREHDPDPSALYCFFYINTIVSPLFGRKSEDEMPPQPVEDKMKKGKKGKTEPDVDELKNNLDKLDIGDEAGKKQNKKGMISN